MAEGKIHKAPPIPTFFDSAKIERAIAFLLHCTVLCDPRGAKTTICETSHVLLIADCSVKVAAVRRKLNRMCKGNLSVSFQQISFYF